MSVKYRTVTQKDIAHRLSISQSHVARVLAGTVGRDASEQTKRLVLDTALEMRYVPQVAGQILRTGVSNSIAFAYVSYDVPGRSSHYGSEIEALTEAVGRFGFKVEVRAFPTNSEVVEWLTTMVRSRSSDAALLWGLESDVEDQASVLESMDFPFVCRGVYENHPHWTQAEFDHYAMIHASVDKLVGIGHKRIAFLGHANDRRYSRTFLSGYQAAMLDVLGYNVPTEWILLSAENYKSLDPILDTVAKWADMPQSERPTAIACGNPGSSFQSVEIALLKQGIRVGDGRDELSMAGQTGGRPMLAGRCWDFDLNSFVDFVLREQVIPLLTDGKPRLTRIAYMPELRQRADALIDSWHDVTITKRKETNYENAKSVHID